MLIRKAGFKKKRISGQNSIFVPGPARLLGPVPAAGCRASHFSETISVKIPEIFQKIPKTAPRTPGIKIKSQKKKNYPYEGPTTQETSQECALNWKTLLPYIWPNACPHPARI